MLLKIDHNWQLTLKSPPDNQYSAGGSQALIDGLTGGADYRTGEWQGFWGEDCVATIDLGQVERILLQVGLGGTLSDRPGHAATRSGPVVMETDTR